ncbi:MAG: BrnT family toxin [Alphaproteobacteria bacterium]|nr:BrnT family toxin [Alphaproteobacteria bacterium]
MIDFGKIEGFEWDDGNSRKSQEKHGVSQAEAEQVFFGEPLLIVPDVKHSTDETRFHALGATGDGRMLHVTFVVRRDGARIRAISACDMHRKERQAYAQET